MTDYAGDEMRELPPAILWSAIAAGIVLIGGFVFALAARSDRVAIDASTTSSIGVPTTLPPTSSSSTSVVIVGSATSSSTTPSTLPPTTRPSPVPAPTAPGRAVVEPNIASPGGRVVVRPYGSVHRACRDIVTVYSAGQAVGQVLPLGQYLVLAAGTAPTYPSCTAEPSPDPVSVLVPSLSPNTYRLCIVAIPSDAGCADLTVVPVPPRSTTTTSSTTSTSTTSTTRPPTTTSTSTSSTSTTSSTTTTSTSTTTTTTTFPPGLTVPIEVVDGTFLGVAPAGLLSAAAQPIRDTTSQGTAVPAGMCRNATSPFWITRLAALEILWEGDTIETARMTNWRYTGATIGGQPELIADTDTDVNLTIGATRREVRDAYTNEVNGVDEIITQFVQFGMSGPATVDTVVWFGRIDCGG